MFLNGIYAKLMELTDVPKWHSFLESLLKLSAARLPRLLWLPQKPLHLHKLTLTLLYLQACDINLDGELDHEEFVRFVQELTSDTFFVVSQGLLITLVVAPTVAMATKKATEGVPAVGKVVQKLPNSIYASLVTLAVVWFQTSHQQVN